MLSGTCPLGGDVLLLVAKQQLSQDGGMIPFIPEWSWHDQSMHVWVKYPCMPYKQVMGYLSCYGQSANMGLSFATLRQVHKGSHTREPGWFTMTCDLKIDFLTINILLITSNFHSFSLGYFLAHHAILFKQPQPYRRLFVYKKNHEI